jgi:purine-binding chemotaxis protein CheW
MKRAPRRKIDWEAARERIARASQGLDEALSPSPEEVRRILDARARALARGADTGADAGPLLAILSFSLSGERWAIETKYVQSTRRSAGTTRVPGLPDVFCGVESLRGEIMAVIDLARVMGMPAAPRPANGYLIVLGQDQAELAVLCDELFEVTTLPRSALVTQGGGRHLAGLTADALLVLDGASLLDDPRLTVDQTETPEIPVTDAEPR